MKLHTFWDWRDRCIGHILLNGIPPKHSGPLAHTRISIIHRTATYSMKIQQTNSVFRWAVVPTMWNMWRWGNVYFYVYSLGQTPTNNDFVVWVCTGRTASDRSPQRHLQEQVWSHIVLLQWARNYSGLPETKSVLKWAVIPNLLNVLRRGSIYWLSLFLWSDTENVLCTVWVCTGCTVSDTIPQQHLQEQLGNHIGLPQLRNYSGLPETKSVFKWAVIPTL